MNHNQRRWQAGIAVLLLAALLLPGAVHIARSGSDEVRLAYVWRDTVTLADAEGQPILSPGPGFDYGQGARLIWTADGRTLYIARGDGLYATGAMGSAPVQLPGNYGRTWTISQDGGTLYYMETVSPQEVEAGIVSYPMREMVISLIDGSVGRLAGYFGRYEAGASRADVTFAAALYSRDGGLLETGRPNLWATYGTTVFGACCFPQPGLGAFNSGNGDFWVYDDIFLPAAAAVNATRTHLAGPTTEGKIRIIDLITSGTRDYAVEIAGGLGTIERIAWSPDDTSLYLLARYDPTTPLQLAVTPSFPVDTRSANVVLYRLNLVNNLIRELTWRADIYGVSSMVATDRYIFATVVEPNTILISAFNNGQLAASIDRSSTALNAYMPATHLWRVDVTTGAAEDILDDVWGLAIRPIR